MDSGARRLSYNAGMDERYRLVFRGEVLDGQHRAVVKRRLMESLKLNDGQLERMFSGSAVVLKRDVDAKMAARYQALFKKAGARLRVFAQEEPGAPAQGAKAGAPDAADRSAGDAKAADTAQQPVAPQAGPPAGTFSLLDPAELDKLVAASAARRLEIDAPDYSLAELGADLGEPREVVPIELPDLDLSLAEVGVDLLDEAPTQPVVELGPLEFELAEVGAVLGEESPRPVPPAPDTSHLEIVEES